MLRPFEKNDAAACFEIILDAVATMGGLNEAARAYVAQKSDAGTLFDELSQFYTVVFEDDGVVLGFGALDGKEITRVYIAPKAQGRGVGSTIMEALEEEARVRRVKIVEAKASPTSVSFYEKLGFEQIRPGRYRTGKAVFQYVVMRKSL